MIALILSLFIFDNMAVSTTETAKTMDCGCAGHSTDTNKTPSVPCPCAAKARRKKLIFISIAVAAIAGLGYWAFKTGKLSALWTWANTTKTVA